MARETPGQRSALRASVCLAIALICLCGTRAEAENRPSNTRLVMAGAAMGLPTYALGVAVHEGSHALAASLVGADVVDYSLIPGWHPRNKKFFFGYVTVRGLRGDGERAWFYLAPKLSDSLLLGGFAFLEGKGNLPSNAYAKTGVLVLATGFWIDFSRDIVAWWDHNDTVKVYNILGLDSEWKRLPARLLHAGLSAAMAYPIVQGYQQLLSREGSGEAMLFPLAQGRF